jgi:hypothetical protein
MVRSMGRLVPMFLMAGVVVAGSATAQERSVVAEVGAGPTVPLGC